VNTTQTPKTVPVIPLADEIKAAREYARKYGMTKRLIKYIARLEVTRRKDEAKA
jgi:hypothetical protein